MKHACVTPLAFILTLAALRADDNTTQEEQFVTITQSVSIPLPNGVTAELPAGSRLKLISKQGSDVHISYVGREYVIPISATDLQSRDKSLKRGKKHRQEGLLRLDRGVRVLSINRDSSY